VNWRKQKDGKTVRESHEKLKVGGVKVLSCCYTRSADNLSFQRRIYWLLAGDPTTVLGHYLTVDKDSGREDGAFCEDSMDELETPGSQYAQRSSLYLNDNNDLDDKEESDPTGSSEISGDEGGESPLDIIIPTPMYPANESIMDFVNSLITNTDNISQVPASPPPQLTPLFNRANDATDLSCANSRLGRLAKISDFSPEWDYIDGGTKILIMGPDFHSGLDYYVMFDQVEVPAELVQDGVLRCRTPVHFKPGFVSFCVTRGNFVLFSEVCHFEYRSRESVSDLMNMNERSFKLRIIERLERLEREVNSANADSITLSESIMDSLSQTLEDKYLSEEQLEEVFIKILVNLMEGIENKDTLNAQDRDGFTLLHYACALRYHALASTIIKYGANVNIQDRNGNTPFHWAMKNRDQTMIRTLVDHVDLNKNSYTQIDQNEYLSPKIPSQRTPSIDGIISGIDELGFPESNGETPLASPIVRNFKVREFEPRSPRGSGPNSPLTPHTRMRRSVIKQEEEEEDCLQTAFDTYRTRRMGKAEDETKKRATKARGSLLAERRR